MVCVYKKQFVLLALLGTVYMGALGASASAHAAGVLSRPVFSSSVLHSRNDVHLAQVPDPRVSGLEQSLRELNGKVEELGHTIEELQKEIIHLGGKAPAPKTVQPLPSPDESNSLDQAENPSPSPVSEEVPQTQTAQELFAMGDAYMKAQNYAAAEKVFMAFPLRYPEDELNGDVTFNLAEARFALKRYREAAQTYLLFYNNYPDAPRQPENLLKLGMSLAALNDIDVACETFSIIGEKYKSTSSAILKQIQEEQKRNKCR